MTNQNQYDDDIIDSSDKIALEIEKRRTDNDREVIKTLRAISQKPEENLSQKDKQFIKARASYLTNAQRHEYADIIAGDWNDVKSSSTPSGEKSLQNMNRLELDQKARELGIDNPEQYPNTKAVLQAVKEALSNN